MFGSVEPISKIVTSPEAQNSPLYHQQVQDDPLYHPEGASFRYLSNASWCAQRVSQCWSCISHIFCCSWRRDHSSEKAPITSYQGQWTEPVSLEAESPPRPRAGSIEVEPPPHQERRSFIEECEELLTPSPLPLHSHRRRASTEL